MLVDFLWGTRPCAPTPPEPSEQTISRVVHLVYGLWDGHALPWRYRSTLGSWHRRHNSSRWDIVLWNRSQAQSLIDRHYPEWASIYKGYTRPVQRADLLRYLILHRYGGFYADLDITCIRSLDGLLEPASGPGMLLQVETVLTPEQAAEIGRSEPIRNGHTEVCERIANYFMASSPQNPILEEMLELVKQRSHLPIQRDYDVLYTTGPDVVSEVVHRHRQSPLLRVIPTSHAETFVRHRFWGSWRQD